MQKLHYFIWVLLFSLATHAQSIPTGENISLDQQLSNISQSSVTSNIIYERVISSANLYNFNKVTTFNTANFPYFKQVLSEMRRASNDTKFISLDAFKTMVAINTAPNEVDIAVLNTQFHILNYIEDNPATGGLTYKTSTNKFVAINGKIPFHMLHNTVIAPAKEFVSGTSVIYKLRNDLFFTNGSKTIKTLLADFGDGINRTVISNSNFSNQNIIINYTSSGEKISKFEITYNDNTTLTTFGKIYFDYNTSSGSGKNSDNLTLGSCATFDPLKQDFSLQADIPFTGYNLGDPTIKAKIDYRIFYAFAHTDKKIRKPIIIIDGFDPGDKRKIEDCDCESIPSCASHNTSNGLFDPQRHRAMKDLMEYSDPNVIGGTVDLLNELRIEGYDVILVNHPTYETTNLQNGQTVTIDGGAYYIESNAMALIKLLQQTKSLLVTNGSNKDIAIVAPSMAGQISRYALSYMEKKFADTALPEWKHNTYLWISVDSPHLGANIPLGDQSLLYLLKEGGIDAAADFYDKELSSPAAKQQLIEFHKAGSSYHLVDQNMLNAQTTSQNMPNNRGNTYFQQHYNNQKNNGTVGSDGWPQNLRKIALVNGSLSGSKQTQTINGSPFIPFSNDGEKVLNLRGFQRVHINLPIGSITFRVHIASLESYSLPSYGAEARIARFKKLFNDKTVKSSNINPRGNMDNAPGGFFDAQADISDSATSQDPVPGVTLSVLHNWSLNNLSVENIFKSISEILGGSEWYRHEFNPIHSFIPSFSAIGHLQPNQNWSNPLNQNLTCSSNKLTPFDSYFGLENNTQHTSFTKESVEWLLKELANQPQSPYFPINENALVGASHICKDVNSTYTFDHVCKIPSAVIYDGNTGWSVEGNLAIVSFTEYSVIVKGTSDEYSSGIIKARFQNGYTLEKEIIIGKPTYMSQPIQNGYDNVSVNSSSNLKVNPPLGAKEYYWTIIENSNSCGCYTTSDGLEFCPSGIVKPKFPNGSTYSYTSSSTWANINWGNCKGTYIVNCYSKNECGLTPINHKVVTVYSNTGGGFDPCEGKLVVFPNPINKNKSNDEIVVNLIYPPDPCDNPTVSGKAGEINNEVKIYDFYGTLLFSQRYNSDDFKISNLSLKPGNYILNVFTSKGFQKKEIIFVE